MTAAARYAAVRANQATKPWRSGFCNPSHDAASHGRCPIDLHGRSCCCDCHQTPATEEVATDSPSRSVAPTPGSGFPTPPAPRSPGFYDDIPEPTYHADRTSLSVSGAKTLLRAPALFRWQQDHPVHKDVFDIGSAAHALVLGVGAPIAVVEADDWRTKDAKAARDAARAEGKTPLLTADYERVQAMADQLSSHRLAMQLLSEGQPEVSAYAEDDATGVLRRCRFDWLGPTILTDYKTAASSDPSVFVKAAANFGYHMQHPWYLDLAADLGHPAQAFAFVVQEKEPPHLVTVIELPPELVDVGRGRNRRALERFRDCTESGVWPGYVPDDTFAQPAAPRWALYDQESA